MDGYNNLSFSCTCLITQGGTKVEFCNYPLGLRDLFQMTTVWALERRRARRKLELAPTSAARELACLGCRHPLALPSRRINCGLRMRLRAECVDNVYLPADISSLLEIRDAFADVGMHLGQCIERHIGE